MSEDICRGDWCLVLRGFLFKQLSNHTNNNFCKVTSSINDNLIVATKCTTLYTVCCINSGLLDAPCNNFHFFLFFSQICLVQKQAMSNVFNKKICGGLPSCKPWYCSIWHLEAREYFWLCGNKAFSETMRWVKFFWSAPFLFLDFACLSIYIFDTSPELFVCLSIYENAETLSRGKWEKWSEDCFYYCS